MAELGVAVEQGHGIERDQLAVARASHDRIHLEILRIFVVEAAKHLAGELRHLLRQRAGKTCLLGELFKRFMGGSLSDVKTQPLHAVPIRFNFDPAAVGHENLTALASRFHGAIIFLFVGNHFRDDDLRNRDAADLAADHVFGRRYRAFKSRPTFTNPSLNREPSASCALATNLLCFIQSLT